MAIFEQVTRENFEQPVKISKKVTRDTKVTRDIFENRNVTGYFLRHGEKKNTARQPPRPL